MPQHKLKVKANKPSKVGKKIKKKGDSQKKNRPQSASKKKVTNTLRKEITKAINTTNENTAKERATADGKTFRVLPSATTFGKTKGKSQKKKK